MKLFWQVQFTYLTHCMVVRAPNSRRHFICFIGPERLLRGAVNFFWLLLLRLLSSASSSSWFLVTHKPQFFTCYLIYPSRSFQTHNLHRALSVCLLMRLTLHVCICLFPREWMSSVMNFVNMLILIYILLSVLEIDSIRVGLLGLFHL